MDEIIYYPGFASKLLKKEEVGEDSDEQAWPRVDNYES